MVFDKEKLLSVFDTTTPRRPPIRSARRPAG